MSEDNAKKIDRILNEPLRMGAFDALAVREEFKLTAYQPGRVVTLPGAEAKNG